LFQRTLFIIGLILLTSIPASAKTDCSEVREEKGQSAYETCKAKEKEEDAQDAIRKNKEAIEDQKDDIKDYYEDIIDQIDDRKKDEDRYLERRERDEKRRLEDLQDDEASKERINAQKEDLKEVQRERKATKKYYEEWIDYIENQEDLENARLDFNQARYELEQRGGSVMRLRWY